MNEYYFCRNCDGELNSMLVMYPMELCPSIIVHGKDGRATLKPDPDWKPSGCPHCGHPKLPNGTFDVYSKCMTFEQKYN